MRGIHKSLTGLRSTILFARRFNVKNFSFQLESKNGQATKNGLRRPLSAALLTPWLLAFICTPVSAAKWGEDISEKEFGTALQIVTKDATDHQFKSLANSPSGR